MFLQLGKVEKAGSSSKIKWRANEDPVKYVFKLELYPTEQSMFWMDGKFR